MRASTLIRTGNATLTEQVVAFLAGQIEGRQLMSGAKLPSIRQFAEANGVSKSVVVEAYERLVAMGLVTSRAKSGFYVLERPALLDIAKAEPIPLGEVDEFWMLRNSLQLASHALRPGCGWLPPSCLNTDGIRRALGRVRKDAADALVDYGNPAGFPALRQQLLRHLATRAIEVPFNRVLLTDNGSQALDLAIRFLVRPGNTVLLDDPCYFNFQASLRAHRVNVISIPLTTQGPDLIAFEKALAEHRPRLYLTNTVLQNPTGISFSAASLHRILLLAQQYDFAIVEDDTLGDLQEGPTPRLSALDGFRRTIYISSFSKTLSGAMRCGYMALPADWVEPILDLKLATTYGNNELSARIIYKLLVDGSYRKHLIALRDKLRRSQPLVRKLLADCGLHPWVVPDGGPFLWVQGAKANTADLARDALKQGILLAPGNVFSVSRSAGQFMRFNIAQAQSPKLLEFLHLAQQQRVSAARAPS